MPMQAVYLLALACASICQAGWLSRTSQRQQEYLAPKMTVDSLLYDIPGVHESAIMARRILHLSTIGTLVTTFPETSDSKTPHSLERRPESLAGNPIGLMEYYADCEPETGNPTFLALSIATPQRNYAAGSNISLSLRWWPEQTSSYAVTQEDYSDCNDDDDDGDDDEYPTPHTPAALPRFSLHGYLEDIGSADLVTRDIPACFIRAHPDAATWQPGNPVHTARYVRLVVEHVYWIGGFGDRARIEWLPTDEWRNVTMEEIAKYRLPGEQRHKHRHRCRSWYEDLKSWF